MRRDLGAILGRREPQLLQDVDWARDPFFRDTLSEYTSVMAIPVIGDRLPMTWAIGLKKPPKQFTVSDLEEAVERAALVGDCWKTRFSPVNWRTPTSRLTVTRGRWANSSGRCSRHPCHESPEWRSRRVRAIGPRGGDLYDFFPLDERQDGRADTPTAPSRWCVFIGDIEGHGLAAATDHGDRAGRAARTSLRDQPRPRAC